MSSYEYYKRHFEKLEETIKCTFDYRRHDFDYLRAERDFLKKYKPTEMCESFIIKDHLVKLDKYLAETYENEDSIWYKNKQPLLSYQLMRQRIETWNQLTQYTKADVLKFRNIGKFKITLIEQELKQRNLSFKKKR